MIKRIPMILFVLTILSLVFMIIVRLDAMGTRLLTMGSGTGKFIAAWYHSSVILFIVLLALLILSVFISLHVKSRRHKTTAEFNEEEAFSNPAAPVDQTGEHSDPSATVSQEGYSNPLAAVNQEGYSNPPATVNQEETYSNPSAPVIREEVYSDLSAPVNQEGEYNSPFIPEIRAEEYNISPASAETGSSQAGPQ